MHHLILKQLVSCGESRLGSPNLLFRPGILGPECHRKRHSHRCMFRYFGM